MPKQRSKKPRRKYNANRSERRQNAQVSFESWNGTKDVSVCVGMGAIKKGLTRAEAGALAVQNAKSIKQNWFFRVEFHCQAQDGTEYIESSEAEIFGTLTTSINR